PWMATGRITGMWASLAVNGSESLHQPKKNLNEAHNRDVGFVSSEWF
ncbi:MAG: hypothetical protein ACI8WB_004943, partial [Phenylobacterium sp.]